MLLFIGEYLDDPVPVMEFQYISCYCLSISIQRNSHSFSNFNTSHVTVYQRWNKRQDVFCFISIHLMLLFITMQADTGGHHAVFQYISCYCLSNGLVFRENLFRYFNTSHVTVYRVGCDMICSCFCHFNTSHVTVYPIHVSGQCKSPCHFNTSHVTVYRALCV